MKQIDRKKNGGIVTIERVIYEDLKVGDGYVYIGKRGGILNLNVSPFDDNCIAKVIKCVNVKNKQQFIKIMTKGFKSMDFEERERFFNLFRPYYG